MSSKGIWQKILFIFLLSYVILYLLSAFNDLTGFSGWGLTLDIFRIDYLYYLMPIPGFFIIFFLIDWIEDFFQTKFTRTPWFPVSFFVLGLIAFYIAIFWYFCNLLSINDASFCSPAGSSNTLNFLSAVVPSQNVLISFLSTSLPGFLSGFFSSLLSTNFVKFFIESAYIIFLLAGIFGWAAKLVYFKLEGKHK